MKCRQQTGIQWRAERQCWGCSCPAWQPSSLSRGRQGRAGQTRPTGAAGALPRPLLAPGSRGRRARKPPAARNTRPCRRPRTSPQLLRPRRRGGGVRARRGVRDSARGRWLTRPAVARGPEPRRERQPGADTAAISPGLRRCGSEGGDRRRRRRRREGRGRWPSRSALRL